MTYGEQIRAARALLRINQLQLAELAHVSLGAIRSLERTRGPLTLSEPIVAAVRGALEAAGISFIDPGPYTGLGGPGVRLAGNVILEDKVVELETSVDAVAGGEAVALPSVSR